MTCVPPPARHRSGVKKNSSALRRWTRLTHKARLAAGRRTAPPPPSRRCHLYRFHPCPPACTPPPPPPPKNTPISISTLILPRPPTGLHHPRAAISPVPPPRSPRRLPTAGASTPTHKKTPGAPSPKNTPQNPPPPPKHPPFPKPPPPTPPPQPSSPKKKTPFNPNPLSQELTRTGSWFEVSGEVGAAGFRPGRAVKPPRATPPPGRPNPEAGADPRHGWARRNAGRFSVDGSRGRKRDIEADVAIKRQLPSLLVESFGARGQ